MARNERRNIPPQERNASATLVVIASSRLSWIAYFFCLTFALCKEQKGPAEAGRLFLISCRQACRLGRDSVSVGRAFDLGSDPAGRASGLDFDSADLVYRWASCFLSSWGTEDNDGKLCSFQKKCKANGTFLTYRMRRPAPVGRHRHLGQYEHEYADRTY